MVLYQNPDLIRRTKGTNMRIAIAKQDIVISRVVWASGTSRDDANPDDAMQKAWDNLLSKVGDVVTNSHYSSKYVTILFRNDIHDPASSSWTVTLTASVELA